MPTVEKEPAVDAFEEYLNNFGEVEGVVRTRFQKIVAKNMVANASSIPHVTHHDLLDVTELMALRRSANGQKKLSPVIYIIKAVAEALKRFPHFNASLSPDGETLFLKKYYHIGVAVDGPLGLLVPVLTNCVEKSLDELGAELGAVAAQARDKGLPITKMQGGCFSISSLGGIGGTYFTPIINAPEVAILGVTSVRQEPHWDGEAFVPRDVLPVSLSYDHRVINGADAARFVREIGRQLVAMTIKGSDK